MPTPLRAIPQYNIILGLLLAIFFLDARMHSVYRKKASRSMLRAKKSRLNYGKKSFTNCDGDYYHAGSDFETYTFGTKTGGAARANRGLTKYSGVQFCYEAMPISAANAAEGVQHKGLTAMLPKQWSERIPNQTKWGPPITPTSGSDPVALTQILIEAPVHLGTAGAIVVEIWEVKGQWYYVLPPETVPERQLIPIDKIGHKVIACGPLKNGGAGLESLPPLPAGPAVTTRDLTDLKPNVPPDCEIPKGTEVTVQHVYSDTGKVDIFVPGNGKRAGKRCPNNFLKVDRADVQRSQPNAGKPVGVVAANVTETEPKTETHGTVIGDAAKLMVRPGPDATLIAEFPSGTRVRIVGYESNDWLRVNIESSLTPQQQNQAKYGPSHGIFGGYMDAKNVKIDGH